MLNVPLHVGLIDSLKLRVKMSSIKVIDKKLTSNYQMYYTDINDFDDELKHPAPMTILRKGITYRIYIKSYITQKKVSEEYCVIQISAKMLKEKYFEGLTINNIDNIIQDINDFGIIKISKHRFLDGLVNDIDICINALIDVKSYKTALSLMKQFPKNSCKPLIHAFGLQGKNDFNIGLDFNKREKATNSRPYCKIYYKGGELQTKSHDFYYAYLAPMRSAVLDNLVRYEFTIKHSKHKKYLSQKGYLKSELKTLKDLLSISQDELTNIAKSGLKCYLEEQKQQKVSNDLSPTDKMIAYYQYQLIQRGFDEAQILGFENSIDCPVAKSRTKKKALYIMYNHVCTGTTLNQKLNENKRVNELFNAFGYGL